MIGPGNFSRRFAKKPGKKARAAAGICSRLKRAAKTGA
jgi:hypothetical protein